MIEKIYYQKINSDVSNLTNLALCFLFLYRNLFFYIQILYGLRSVFRPNIVKKMESCKPLKLATILRTVQFYRGLSNFMHFSHREVLRAKRTEMTRGSWLTGSNRTVWSGFENHGNQ